jgi:seryl-tRNA synthetase
MVDSIPIWKQAGTMKYHFDVKGILAKPDEFVAAMKRRGHDPHIDKIQQFASRRSDALTRLQDTRSLIKAKSQEIGKAMKEGNTASADALKELVKLLKQNETMWAAQATHAEEMLEAFLIMCPNVPAADVPDGTDETSNVEVRRWGKVGARDGTPHYELDQVDLGFDAAAKISGSRFSMLQGPVARLHRALGQFMLDEQIKRGYREVIPPTIVNEEALYGTGQLPKFKEDLFGIADEDGASEPTQFLIPTAEVSLTNIHADQILLGGRHRYVALTDCYRSEAGSAGRDTRGLIRQHQFQKVELVTVCEPSQSAHEHDYMLNAAEQILAKLDLTYRTMLLCAGDMGFSAQKTYDIEVWLPGQNTYREISSVSNCGDFQARRMNTRYKVNGETFYAHTLNGSGLAVGRTLVAVLENYQTTDDVMIPEVLRPYMLNCHYLSELDMGQRYLDDKVRVT